MNQPLLSMTVPAAVVLAASVMVLFATSGPASAATAAYDRIEASFELPQVQGNPFDFTQNDVKATIVGPDGTEVTLPAFFDGGQTWRVRHTPTAPGAYTVMSVTLNGADADPQNLEPQAFEVVGESRPGFVRLDPDNRMRFILDDGSPYYPVGYNLGWRHMGDPPMPPLPESINRMGNAGVNWTRIWMNHWDGKNLDWSNDPEQTVDIGLIDLASAKLWDEIVAALDANDVRFQLALQHHGQYSTGSDANWQINPWNTANGGWLDSPVQFFTDERARQLTKNKYRYIIARWGYSPSVMAWELFNEVEYTDAFREDLDAVAAWHKEMAEFLREHDTYGHLVTTSSRVTEPSIWPAMDYYQSHVYPPDLLAAIQTLDAYDLDRAYFYGEIGGAAFGPQPNPGDAVHRILWGSLMSQASGAAQYWFWYIVEPNDLLFHYTAAQNFIEQSGVLAHEDLETIQVGIQTEGRGPMRFGPGTGWAPSTRTDFTVTTSGNVEGIGGMSSYLQGEANREMFPHAVFNVDYPEDGTFAMRLSEMTRDGARLEVSLDGEPAATLELGAAPAFGGGRGGGGGQQRRNVRLNTAIEIPVPAGEHAIRLDNTGADWVQIREIVLAPYAPQLAVMAKGNDELVVLWAYRREPAAEGEAVQPMTGTLTVPGLSAGAYEVVWFDTYKGEPLKTEQLTAADGGGLELTTPPIESDVAAWIKRAE